MNKWNGIGRLTRHPEVRYTQGENSSAIARFTLAVDRRGRKAQDGQPTADFIPCVAFGKQGEFAEKYLKQGTKIAVTGHIQTGSYTNRDGQKVYTTEVIIEEVEFCESKAAAGGQKAASAAKSAPATDTAAPAEDAVEDAAGGFMNIPDGIDDDEGLPFD